MNRGAQLALQLEDPPRRRRAAGRESFHVRSHVTAEEATAGEARAAGQEDLVLKVFRAQGRGYRLTPSEVHRAFARWPITSVRRALTNLTRKGLLVHHQADRRPGPHGALESTWGLA